MLSFKDSQDTEWVVEQVKDEDLPAGLLAMLSDSRLMAGLTPITAAVNYTRGMKYR